MTRTNRVPPRTGAPQRRGSSSTARTRADPRAGSPGNGSRRRRRRLRWLRWQPHHRRGRATNRKARPRRHSCCLGRSMLRAGTAPVGRWITGGEFINELLAATIDGYGETPYRASNSLPLPLPSPTSSGSAPAGWTARSQGVRPRVRHRWSSEHHGERRRIHRFLCLLNSVPPRAPVELRRKPLMRWWSRVLAWWRRRSRWAAVPTADASRSLGSAPIVWCDRRDHGRFHPG